MGFKIDTTLATFSVDIYRLGYYQGNGARKIASLGSIAGTDQPACKSEAATGLIDWGNWSQSASWTLPPTVSGIYFALRPRRIRGVRCLFVVPTTKPLDLLMQTSDTTWQGSWAVNSFYVGGPGTSGNTPRAYKSVTSRSPTTAADTVLATSGRGDTMVRFLESNGYDGSATTGWTATGAVT